MLLEMGVIERSDSGRKGYYVKQAAHTFHHLAEITEAIRSLRYPIKKVIGIDTRITAETMLQIARFPRANIGVVSTKMRPPKRMMHMS